MAKKKIQKKQQQNRQKFLLIALAAVVLTMSVGFALYAQTLSINGQVQVDKSKWSVHFVTSSYAEDSGSVVASEKTIADTTMSYKAELRKPGDFYSFTINVINDGTFDATLKTITLSSLTTAQSKYLTYELTYEGNTYTTSQTGLNFSLPAATGTNIKPVKVKATYITPSSEAELPNENVTVSLTATLGYEQAQ